MAKKKKKLKNGTHYKAQAKNKITLPAFNGDHGTGTTLATMGTIIEEITNDEGRNPNNVARRRRVEAIDAMRGLSMRQWQAAREIRDAYCQCEKLSSGSPLKEQVDSSPKPDETIAIQVDAQSRLHRAMAGVPSGIPRKIVEAICWENKRPEDLPQAWANVSAQFKITMDLVANKLRY